MSKIRTMNEVLDLIHDGATVAASGFLLWGLADEVFKAVEDRYLETGHPAGITCVFTGSAGLENSGFDRWAHDGLIDNIIMGHCGLTPRIPAYINANKCRAYNFPLGVVQNMYRASLLKQKGFLSKIGLKTFADPRLDGGKMNDLTTEDLVKVVEFEGEEWLYYPVPKFDVALIRGTTADEYGNISIEEECGPMNMRDIAMGVKAAGGKVIVQVKYLSGDKLPGVSIEIPGVFVDAVVVSKEPETYHRMTKNIYYDAARTGRFNIPTDSMAELPLDARKVIARRCAMELQPESIVNLGIGIPTLVASVAGEEGFSADLIMSSEDGMLGGIPGTGDTFGSAVNAIGMLSMAYNFDLYNGGNLSMAVEGLAECDAKGNINVGKFGTMMPGCGGFIDVTQLTPLVIFAGTFTAGGAKYQVADGKLTILQEGRSRKFRQHVQQVTFSADYAAESGQKVLYVTERAVMRLTKEGIVLEEIAPGVDLQKDILDQMDFAPIVSPDLKLMDARIFTAGRMGFAIK